jgi:3-keto-5-aminohexanoate cleavage enzyme
MTWDAPLVIAVAPNGARRTKADHPAIPLTVDEIAHTAAACCEAGAALIHLHVRSADGQHLLDAGAYEAATAAIRREAGSDMIVQITTEAVGRYSPAEQMAVVDAVRPEACSVAVRELCPDAASEPAFADFLQRSARNSVHVQFILYDEPDRARLDELVRRGLVPFDAPCLLFVLGRYVTDRTSLPADLLPFLHAGVPAQPWFVCAFGAAEGACALTAAALGGHARVGFENNLQLNDGTTAPDNAALVAQQTRGAALIGRPVADGSAARAALSIRS